MNKEQQVQKMAGKIESFNYVHVQGLISSHQLGGNVMHDSAVKLAQALWDADCRIVTELPLIGEDEQLACSLTGKYPFKEVKDVIEEACKHQRDADLKRIRGE